MNSLSGSSLDYGVFKKGETEYSINALPIGGYVSIYGENPDDESTNGKDKERSFVNKPKYIQALVLWWQEL
jgi:regulator of sigma E protease